MNKTYSAICGNFEAEFQAPTARASLDLAMKYAQRCVKRGKSVTVFCGKNIVWTSQNPLTTATV